MSVSSNEQNKKNNLCLWFVDSGATNHMTPHEKLLINIKKSHITDVSVANSENMNVTGVGDMKIKLKGREVDVKNVLLVPGLSTNLLSVSQMIQNGNSVMFDNNGCRVLSKNNEIIAKAENFSGIYKFELENYLAY